MHIIVSHIGKFTKSVLVRILNKLTPDNFEKLSFELAHHAGINNKEILKGAILLVSSTVRLHVFAHFAFVKLQSIIYQRVLVIFEGPYVHVLSQVKPYYETCNNYVQV